jgi:hypothetical protein
MPHSLFVSPAVYTPVSLITFELMEEISSNLDTNYATRIQSTFEYFYFLSHRGRENPSHWRETRHSSYVLLMFYVMTYARFHKRFFMYVKELYGGS